MRLLAADDPVLLLRSWLAKRAALRVYSGAPDDLAALLRDERVISPSRLTELDVLMDTLRRADPLQAESDYVELFDRGRATSLHLFEHVHGDSRERGPAMIDLGQTYEKAGLIEAVDRSFALNGNRVAVAEQAGVLAA